MLSRGGPCYALKRPGFTCARHPSIAPRDYLLCIPPLGSERAKPPTPHSISLSVVPPENTFPPN